MARVAKVLRMFQNRDMLSRHFRGAPAALRAAPPATSSSQPSSGAAGEPAAGPLSARWASMFRKEFNKPPCRSCYGGPVTPQNPASVAPPPAL